MTAKEQLLQEIQRSPEILIQEVLDFFLFTRSRRFNYSEPEIIEEQATNQPIWEFAQELMQDAPPEELSKLPADSDRNATLLATIEALPDLQKWQIYQTLSVKFAPHSAEAKAISRLPDQDDPTKWITSIEEEEPIDEQALNAWLEKKGYQKANV
ncbi:hypothetical protein APA_1093 [Pseudanabaena sp. lw0831]|uniref:hypothetical protein n=1 Tax=Pseudanabaena sp. lw0831 TaxID=1357935 RepID=UPI0019160346|nr:hypothetical protein [Pseudanabaena sp. lw0831]GBO53186.1 hypothetical protein APA_1093 [Pseudanabaena sp. lw0831]